MRSCVGACAMELETRDADVKCLAILPPSPKAVRADLRELQIRILGEGGAFPVAFTLILIPLYIFFKLSCHPSQNFNFIAASEPDIPVISHHRRGSLDT